VLGLRQVSCESFAGRARRPPVIVGHSGDGRPNVCISARYARIRPALFSPLSRPWVNRGE
jgi:hypothetical protein